VSPGALGGAGFRRALVASPATALAVFALVLAGLLANGRPIGAGDTRASERTAASLVGEGDFDLDEYPEVSAPFAREVAGRRLSIYPPLSALLAAPLFAAARALFELDEAGSALAGKLAASLLSSLAAAVMFLAVGRRWPRPAAAATALLFAFGTSVWSTSQSLWQHPAALLFLALALLALVRAEDDDAWAARAGLPLALAVAARHAALPLVAVLAAGILVRWPRRTLGFALWAAPAILGVLLYDALHFGSPFAHGFSGSLSQRFSGAWGTGHLGLLLSPGRGLLVFTPLAAVAALGWFRELRRPFERPLAASLGCAVLAHWLVMGAWGEWPGGWCWGPRLMSETLPLLFFFLPAGLERAGRLGALAAAVSVLFQAVGAFSYDYRQERLLVRRGEDPMSVVWSLEDGPLVFHLRERVAILAAPGIQAGRVFERRHPVVLFGPAGRKLQARAGALELSGQPAGLGDVHLQRGAQVVEDAVRFRGRWAALFARVRPAARQGPHVLVVRGRGRGVLYLGEGSFWRRHPEWHEFRMAGRFEIRHPWSYPESGGADLSLTLGRGRGEADIESLELVPGR
jgi:hypothetical protein